MALSYRFYHEQKILLTSWSGENIDTDLLRFYISIYNSRDWSAGFSEVLDLRDAQLEAVSNKALQQLSEIIAICLNGSALKLAIISLSELTDHEKRVYDAFALIPNQSTRVVRHLDTALKWLI